MEKYRYKGIGGRYVTINELESFYEMLSDLFEIKTEGFSVENRAVKSVKVGVGNVRVFMWSQMHGNESTTTKAVVDLLLFLNSGIEETKRFLEEFTIVVLPIVNPDGAFNYTRVNANGVDLNRDAVNITQPESKILRKVFDEFKPNFAFNLHDQRTIFGVGNTAFPATISLLVPSCDEERSLNETRCKAMRLVVALKNRLETVIPNRISRFDDGFNLNCIGDYFQYRGVPTVLIEAGHSYGDYEREDVRAFVFFALMAVLEELVLEKYEDNKIEDYFLIPENNKNLVDVVLRNVLDPFDGGFWSVSLMYKEELFNGEVLFIPIITEISKKVIKFAHVDVNDALKFIYDVGGVDGLIDRKAFEVIDFGTLTVNDLLKKQQLRSIL